MNEYINTIVSIAGFAAAIIALNLQRKEIIKNSRITRLSASLQIVGRRIGSIENIIRDKHADPEFRDYRPEVRYLKDTLYPERRRLEELFRDEASEAEGVFKKVNFDELDRNSEIDK